MAIFTPGALILWRPSGSEQPLWPAVVCVDDLAPEEFLGTRPQGYVTLILRISERLDFHWATATEIHEYNPFLPFEDENTVANTLGLGESFAIANSVLEAGLGLDHWRAQVKKDTIVILPDNETYSESEQKSESDSELQLAIRESRKDYDLYSFPFHEHDQVQPPHPNSETQPCLKMRETTGQAKKRLASQGATHLTHLPFDQTSKSFLSWGRLANKPPDPVSDVIEGDLTTSKDFVQIRVGIEGEERLLTKACVWNRPYFNNPVIGLMHFTVTEDGNMELSHPNICDVDPEDFVFAAEYLESGEFGYTHPRGEAEMQEAFAQCISAWATAEKLGMTDLMDHIVDKLKTRMEPDLWDMMAFACQFYEKLNPSSPMHKGLRDFLATYIAENFWIYVRDDHLQSSFVERLMALPELERDLYLRRLKALDQRLQSEDGDWNGEE